MLNSTLTHRPLGNSLGIVFLILLFSTILKAQVHLGTGQAYPNIQTAASANAISPGDTVFLHAGSYSGYQAIADLQGTDSAWIVIQPYLNESHDIAGGWQFIRCAYIKFQNLNFKGNAIYPGRLFSIDNGGSCNTQSEFIIVDSCTFANTTIASASVAFKFAGVDHFEVTNCTFKDIPACEAMSFNTCHDGRIRGNRLENCLSGGHIKGGASNITMDRNLFINASSGTWVAYELGGDTSPEFYCPGDEFEVKNINFYSNIIIGGYRGVALSSARDCRVVHNTFYNCGQATMRFLNTSNLYPSLSGNSIENNLFAFGNSAYMNGSTQPLGAVFFSHNIYFSLINTIFSGPYWDSPALDQIKDPIPLNYGSNTPMFINGPGNDFHLTPGSPAIQNGKPQSEPVSDFYGNPFSTTTPSIGAIEIELNTLVKNQVNTRNKPSIYPNPASDFIHFPLSDYIGPVYIVSISGAIIQESPSGAKVFIGNLPAGFYYVKWDMYWIPFTKF